MIFTFTAIISIGLIVGILIGTVGIGGVLLAPALALVLGLDIQLAMATGIWSFLFTGAMGAYTYGKRGSIDWRMAGWLALGIIPASLLGARTNTILSPTLLAALLIIILLYSAANALFKRQDSHKASPEIATYWLIIIGIVVGFGSALTGTGGAVILMPIFLLLHVPALKAVGVVQGIQLPIALFGSVGFILFGEVDFILGTSLGIIQAIGVFIGTKIAHNVPMHRLRQLAAYALILSALVLFQKMITGL